MYKSNLLISKYTLLLYYAFTISIICNATNADGSVQDRITPLEQRVTKLEQDVNELKNAQQDTNQRIQSVQSEQENARKIIQDVQTSNQDIQNKNKNITQEIQNITKSITELSNRINSLDNNYKKNIDDINNNLSKVNEHINQISDIKDDIKHYNDDIEKIYKKNSQLGKCVEEHSESLKQLLQEIKEMKELFCNNVLDGKCSLDDFSKLVKSASKNWKKGNISDLINNIQKKDENTTKDSNNEQTNVVLQDKDNKDNVTQQNGINSDIFISLLQQIQSNGQNNQSFDNLLKMIQQYANQQNAVGQKQMDAYNQLFQYINQLNNMNQSGNNNIDKELLIQYLEKQKSLSPQQFQEWLERQKVVNPQHYKILLEIQNKFNQQQLPNGRVKNPGTIPYGVFGTTILPYPYNYNYNYGYLPQQIKPTIAGKPGTPSYPHDGTNQFDDNNGSDDTGYGPTDQQQDNSQYDGSYSYVGQQYRPWYYNEWPYNRNDPNYRPTNDNNNEDYINPNNPNNIHPKNKIIKRIDQNGNRSFVILTDCNGKTRKLSQNDVMYLIRKGVIQYKCN